MNPFRSRKKSIAEGDAGKSRVSLDNVPAMPAVPNTTTSRGRTFRRKKSQPEPKPEINIQDVLPSTEDFRTSLLMPNLSARFSMLREQDDPNSKIGKANDDSVLDPRRHSKLGLFSPDGLSDIAEVSSLAGSIRPPFAMDRTNSYSSMGLDDGYGTDDGGSTHGSVMSRAKPGQGNKFFGGRQKVYKVPLAGASKGDLNGEAGEKPMGKAMYNDDISMSAFQKMREDRKAQGRESLDEVGRDSRDNDRSGSPPLAGYNRNRETSSSTNSGPPDGRTSTAATSIASQPGATWYASGSTGFGTKPSPVTTPGAERPHKGKRLYGQGLDQQMMDQQSSALNRLNSIQRNGFNGSGVALSRSTSNLNERFNRSGFFSPVSNPRSGSPSPVNAPGLGGFDFGTNGENSRSASKDREGIAQNTPPMSPQTDPTLAAALDANDHGKATASGAFNKPKTQYNEQQFAQRQLQLQEGRETPPPRSFSRQDSHSNEYNGRLRNGSMASVQSAHSSKHQFRPGQSSRAPSNASNHKARASPVDPNPAANGAYLAENSSSEYGSGPNSPEPELPTLKPTTYQKPPPIETAVRSTIYEHDDQHPAFRNQPDRLYIEPSDDEDDLSSSPRASNDNHRKSLERPKKQSMDSPTLGGVDTGDHLGGGLSDLVKGHLRQHSNASSVYPSSPTMDQENANDGPWSKPAPTSHVNEPPSLDPINPPSALGVRARQVLEQANQLANANAKAHDVLGGVGADKVQQVLGGEAPRRSNESGRAAWQEQLKGHNRGGSTETQKEREDFASELADRRKLVQEKLKNFADDGSRPLVNSNDNSPAKSSPFGLLKKSSRGSLAKPGDDSKAAKMLGLGGNAMPVGPSPTHTPDAYGNGSQSRDPSRGPRPRAPDANGRVGAGDGPSFRDRSIGAERREKFFRKTNPSPHAHIERFNGPEATPPPPPAPFGFQRSRTDPANQPMSFHPAGRARKYSPPRPSTVAPAVDIPASEPASRSNSAMGHRPGPGRSPAGSYFPPHPTPSPGGRDSPHAQNMNLPPMMGNPRPSPVAPGFSAHTTPPLELPPHVQQQQIPQMMAQNPAAQMNRNAARKRSINKQDISEPTFVSGTSSVITVDLPAGASLLNGMPDMQAGAPPVPPINPRRRRAQPTQNLFTAFGSKSAMLGGTQSTPNSARPGTPSESPYEERSTFSGDEESKPSKPRSKLRKTSSEGGNLAAKARHQALLKEAEQMPPSPGGPRRRS